MLNFFCFVYSDYHCRFKLAKTLLFIIWILYSLIFSLNYSFKLIHSLCVCFIGIFIVALFSVFYLSNYLYRNKSTHFLINVYRKKIAYSIMFIMFSLRPFTGAAIHVYFQQKPHILIILIIALEAVFIVFKILM